MRSESFLIHFIGYNGMGKTIEAKRIANLWKQANPKGRLIAHDPRHEWRGIAHEFIDTGSPDWAEKMSKRRNILLILDEFKMLHSADNRTAGDIALMGNRRDWGIDILVLVHNPKQVLNYYAEFCHHYLIYYTASLSKSWKDKLPEYEYPAAASRLINAYITKYGPATYPGPFPRVDVNIRAKTINYINMSDERVQALIQHA